MLKNLIVLAMEKYKKDVELQEKDKLKFKALWIETNNLPRKTILPIISSIAKVCKVYYNKYLKEVERNYITYCWHYHTEPWSLRLKSYRVDNYFRD